MGRALLGRTANRVGRRREEWGPGRCSLFFREEDLRPCLHGQGKESVDRERWLRQKRE